GGGADMYVMALYEDGVGAPADQARSRHRPRAAPGDDGSVAGRPIGGAPGIAAEHGAHLVAGEGGPVGLDQLLAHAVDEPGRRLPAHAVTPLLTPRSPRGAGSPPLRALPQGTVTNVSGVAADVTATTSSLRRHYPVRFKRSVARSVWPATLSARSARAPVIAASTLSPVARVQGPAAPRPVAALVPLRRVFDRRVPL